MTHPTRTLPARVDRDALLTALAASIRRDSVLLERYTDRRDLAATLRGIANYAELQRQEPPVTAPPCMVDGVPKVLCGCEDAHPCLGDQVCPRCGWRARS